MQAADAGCGGAGAAESLGCMAGACGGGGHRPRGFVGQRGSHLARGAVSEPASGAQGACAAGVCADRAVVRVPAVHGLGLDGAGRARRGQAEVLELHSAAGVREANGRGAVAGPGWGGDRQGPRGRWAERGRADGAVRRDAAGGGRGDADRGGRAAGRAGGERATFVVNRNINFTNICTVGCAFCGFGQGRRSPDAYEVGEEEFAARIEEAVEFGATEICMQGGIHPDLTLEEYGKWLRLAKDVAPQLHLHAYSPMEVHYMCERSGKQPQEVFEYLLECGLGSTPGTAAEVLDDGVRQRISPNKLPADRWVEIVEASHRAGLRSTSTVMFGHIEEPRELARHMRVVRALQERTGGITEFVPLSFIPFNTMLGRTHGIEEITAEENLKHTAAFRLALGRTIPNLQASWVKMGLGAATEALRWGVNDLGGTLMEENISRMAGSQHGVRLEPEQLIEAARAAGRDPAQRTTLYEIVETYPPTW